MAPLTVHITVKIEPTKLPAFYEALKVIHAHLVKEEKCLYINVFEVMGPPGVVRMVEIWDCDLEYMGSVQSKKEYYLPFISAVSEMALEPQTLEILTGVEGFKFARS